MKLSSNPKVKEVFENYPKEYRMKMLELRNLVLHTAKSINNIEEIEETLKWGEPSYLTKKGSTLRMDWKAKNPDQYAMYFKCTSKLVETFKVVYGDTFNYEGNRAIVFNLKDEIPEKELKQCIKAALMYHDVKHQVNLGIK
jgi:hypothetical protein